jgi:hypothetical protein
MFQMTEHILPSMSINFKFKIPRNFRDITSDSLCTRSEEFKCRCEKLAALNSSFHKLFFERKPQ